MINAKADAKFNLNVITIKSVTLSLLVNVFIFLWIASHSCLVSTSETQEMENFDVSTYVSTHLQLISNFNLDRYFDSNTNLDVH